MGSPFHGGGCSGITNVFVMFGDGEYEDGKYEARCGYALFGNSMMSDEALAAIENNPFHGEFSDNYASGFGDTEQEALDNLQKAMIKIGNSLW